MRQAEVDKDSCPVVMAVLVTLDWGAGAASAVVGWGVMLLLMALGSVAHSCILLACAARADAGHMRPAEAARNPSWDGAGSSLER